jgi:hypothetical protein
MRGIQRWVLVLCVPGFVVVCSGAQSYPVVAALQRTFDVPDVGKANVSLDIPSVNGASLYRLECRSSGNSPEPASFDYSGDFECKLSSVGGLEPYSTLLTEDAHQSRDWESRGRFFSAELRGDCARIPEFGATRHFKLRGMKLTLQALDAVFTERGNLSSLKLAVTVRPDPHARRPIAEIVPIPETKIAADCHLRELFVDFVKLSTSR